MTKENDMTAIGDAMRRAHITPHAGNPPELVETAIKLANVLSNPATPDRTLAAATHIAAMMDGMDRAEAVQVLDLAMVMLTTEGGEG